jgi:hypothetical protein
MKTLKLYLILALGVSVVHSSFAAQKAPKPVSAKEIKLEFEAGDRPLKSYSFKELSRLLPPQEVNFLEPHTLQQKQMHGFKFVDLLKLVYGNQLDTAKKITFTCIDGYKPFLPLNNLLAGNPYLAFAEKGKSQFQIKKEGKIVNVGPYYLIWDHQMTGDKLQDHLKQGHWPYQIKAINLLKE